MLYFEEKKGKIAAYQLWLKKEIYMIVDFITVSIKLQAPIYVGIVYIDRNILSNAARKKNAL